MTTLYDEILWQYLLTVIISLACQRFCGIFGKKISDENGQRKWSARIPATDFECCNKIPTIVLSFSLQLSFYP